MTRNPYLNALVAALYIVLIVVVVTYGPFMARQKPDTIFAPIAVLSLLVLSVAFMALAFFLQPTLMYLEGQKQEAIGLFTRTLAVFAGITVIVVGIAFVL